MTPEQERRPPEEEAPLDGSAAGKQAEKQILSHGGNANKPPERPRPMPSSSPDPRPSDEDLAREALGLLSPARADDRDQWVKVGMALHATSQGLRGAWIEWSRQSNKFKEGECERIWRGFKPDSASGLSLGSLIRWAREDSGDQGFAKGTHGEVSGSAFKTLETAAATLASLAGGTLGGLWKYTDQEGNQVFAVARFDLPGEDARGKPNKTYRPIRRTGDKYVTGDPKGPLPLYRLADLPDGGPIILVEGEKAADAGASIGLATTTSAHGAQSPAKTDWSWLAGRDVLILPDNDLAGISYALKAGAILEKLDPPARVRAWRLSDLPAGGDLYEFVQARRESGRTDPQIREEIESLAGTAGSLAGLEGAVHGDASIFSDPIPLPSDRPPVPSFNFDLLPSALEPWIRDIALRMQCAADFLFAAAMVALAAVIGRRVAIRPKRFDSWLVVVNLWGGVIGRPGLLKTPAVQEVLRPLNKLERDAAEKFKDAKRAFKAASYKADAHKKALEADLKKAVKNGGGDDIAKQIVEIMPEEPARTRLIVNDSTVEKLGEILSENPNGVLCYRDELLGLLKSLDKEGQEGARTFYLQAWNGDSGYTYDRIIRGTVDIESAIVSVFGSIQPGPLREYVSGAVAYGKADDGLLQRFQLLVYPNQTRAWNNVDQAPDTDARDAAYEVFVRLNAITALDVGAEIEFRDTAEIPFLHFDGPAQERFDAWRAALEDRLRSGDEEEIFESYLAKQRSLVPSLALIYHMVDVGCGPVRVESLERAIRACDYLEGHARRVYAVAMNPGLAAAHALAKKLLNRKVASPFTLRDVYQHGWSQLRSASEVGKAVDVLLDYDWLVQTKSQGATGAPRTSYVVNPKIWSCAQEGTGKTGGSPSSTDPASDGPGQGASKTGRTPESDSSSTESDADTPKTGKSLDESSGGLGGSTGRLFDDESDLGPEVHDA